MKKTGRYFLAALIILSLYLSFIVVKPYMISLIAAIFIAYLSYPIHKRLTKIVKRKGLSAFLISVSIVLMILVPSILMINFAANEATSLYTFTKSALDFNVPAKCISESTISCRVLGWIASLTSGELKDVTANIIRKMGDFLISQGSNFLLTIPNVILNIFITIFVIYYLLKDALPFKDVLQKMLPLEKEQFHDLRASFDKMIKGIVVGQIIVALIQGFIASIGYWIFGLHSIFLLGFLTAIAALIPVVGTGFIWFPASLYLIIDGILNYSNPMVIKGFLLLLYGAIIVSSIDNFIRPKLVSHTSRIHPVIVLIGVLGGIKAFGIFGFILGPIVLTGALTFIEVFKRDINAAKS